MIKKTKSSKKVARPKISTKSKFQPLQALIAVAVVAGAAILTHLPHASADTLPNLSVSNATVVEGDSGYTKLNFKVTLSAPSATKVTFRYSTVNDYSPIPQNANDNYGSASGEATVSSTADYLATTNVASSIAAGAVEKSITIKVIGDTRPEIAETLMLNITNVVGANVIDGIGTGTIVDDDSSTGFRLGIGDASIRNGSQSNRTVDVPVQFSAAAPQAFTMTVKTVAGTAVAGIDYMAKTTTFKVAAGATFKNFTVTLLPNANTAPTKNLTVTVTSNYGTVVKSVGTIEIRDGQATYVRAGRRPGPPRVSLLGDSVTANYQDSAKTALESRGYQVFVHGTPAAGLEDAAWCQNQYTNGVLASDDPDIVVFEQVGNYGWFAKCNNAVAYNTPEFISAWEDVATQSTSILTSHGAKLYWLIDPSTSIPDRNNVILTLNPFYQQLASNYPNTYTIDAWTPFGGNPTNCNLRDSLCLHLSPAGKALLSNIVVSGIN